MEKRQEKRIVVRKEKTADKEQGNRIEEIIKRQIITYIERLEKSDMIFLRRIYISTEEYIKEKDSSREK